jgi:hypothetical protein
VVVREGRNAERVRNISFNSAIMVLYAEVKIGEELSGNNVFLTSFV